MSSREGITQQQQCAMSNGAAASIRFGTWPCQVLTHLLGVPLWCEREGRTAQNRHKISSKPDPRAIFCSVTAQYKRGGKPAIQNRLCWEVESYMATVVFVVSVSKRGCRGTLFFWSCSPIKQNLKRSSHDVVHAPCRRAYSQLGS